MSECYPHTPAMLQLPYSSVFPDELKSLKTPTCLKVHLPGTRFCTFGKCLDPEIENDLKSNKESLLEWFSSKSDVEQFNILQNLKKKK